MSVSVSEAARALLAANNILVITHRRPDGDTTGCAGALCRGLRQLGKTAYILQNPDITKRYAPLIVPCYPPDDFEPDYVVTVDIADVALLTPNAERYSVDLVIDHHQKNTVDGKMHLVRSEAAACAEVVYDVLKEMMVTLTKDIGECLYIGVSTDTGCFKFSNTQPYTLRVAAKCLEAGVDGGEINRALFEVKTKARFQMERIVSETLEFMQNDEIALAMIYRADMDRIGADADDLDSIASLPRRIEGVKVGITLTENKDGTVKASVRTTREVSACDICARLGGGGHLRAGGVSMNCGMMQAKEMILQAAQEVYNESGI